MGKKPLSLLQREKIELTHQLNNTKPIFDSDNQQTTLQKQSKSEEEQTKLQQKPAFKGRSRSVARHYSNTGFKNQVVYNDDMIDTMSKWNNKMELQARQNQSRMNSVKKQRVQVDKMILDYKKAKLREYEQQGNLLNF